MEILCEITPWTERVAERGRGAGSVIKTRCVVAANQWDWTIATQDHDEATQPTGAKFYGNMKTLVQDLPDEDGINRIIKTLTALSNKNLNELPPRPMYSDRKAIGSWIDDNFGTSYLREYPPQVMRHIFNKEIEE